MSRRGIVGLAVWSGAVGLLVFGYAAGLWPHLANAYLCAWLVLVSLPLGALPLLMALELWDGGEAAVAGPLRLLLASLPVLAILILPLFFSLHGAYTWQACLLPHCPPFHYAGLGARWFTPGAFLWRSIIYLVLWVGLSLYFLRPVRAGGSRRALAAFGLGLHLVIGTLASYDWFMSLDEGLVSANYGLFVITLQCAFALGAALLLTLARGVDPDRGTLCAFLVLVALAVFAHFAEFIVVWSANLPKEIAWYQNRAGGGRAFAVVAAVLVFFGIVALVPKRLNEYRSVVAAATVALTLVAFVDLVLMASPSGLFLDNAGADLVVLVVLGTLGIACARILGGRRREALRHG